MVNGAPYVEVAIGGTRVNLFARAIYETDEAPLPEGFLHAAFFVADLDAMLADGWDAWLCAGPEVIEGAFGRRRIAFFNAPGGVRIEFMEDVGRHD